MLHDVSLGDMEGHCRPLAHRGYSRDGRRGTLQIVYGLLCAPDSCPVAIVGFEGNAADPKTLTTQAEKLKRRLHLDHAVLVADHGMITQARIADDARAAVLDWITALRAPAIQALLHSGTLQLLPFDQRDMASLPHATLDDAATVRSYKSPDRVERAVRCIKTVDLRARPVHHWLAERVRT